MSVGSRMKERRESLGMTQVQLAELLGVTKGAIGNYETDANSPKASILYKVFEVLKCDANYLFQDEIRERREHTATPQEMEQLVKKYRSLDPYGKEAVDGILNIEYKRCMAAKVLPVEDAETQVEYIRHYLTSAAAGYAAPIEGEDYELVVRGADVPAKADFCLDISGDSMEPYIKDGQTVYVQRAAELHEFEVGIFFVDGDVYCKQWCPGYAGETYLLSANPKRQDANITIWKDSGRNCVYFGKVLLDKKLPSPYYL